MVKSKDLGKFFNLSEPQFLHLQNEGNYGAYPPTPKHGLIFPGKGGAQVPALLISSVTLGKSLNLSVPQSTHL